MKRAALATFVWCVLASLLCTALVVGLGLEARSAWRRM